MDAWGVQTPEIAILLGASTKSVGRWESHVGTLSHDTRERIGYVLGIYAGLCSIFDSSKTAGEWIHAPNRDFGDQSPLSRMIAGNVGDLYAVQTYVEQWKTGAW